MKQFTANLQNELFKLSRRKKYLVFFILACGVCQISALRGLVADRIWGEELPASALLGGLIQSNLPILVLVFLPLAAILASSDLFAGELSDHTLRFTLSRPVSKMSIFFSKALAVFILCVVYLAGGVGLTLINQVAWGGGLQGILSGLVSAVLDLIPMAVLVLFFCFINQIVSGSGLTVLLSLVAYILLIVVGTYAPAAGGLLFTGYLRWHNLWVGTTLPFLSLLPRIGILVGYGLVFACGGYLLFDRKNA